MAMPCGEKPRLISAGFADPAGDSNLAPDITGVAVANDDAGNVGFGVLLPNRTSSLIEGDYVSIDVDADRNRSTGCGSLGAEYALGALGKTGTDFYSLGQCQGGAWNFSIGQGSFSGSWDATKNMLFFFANRRDLGGTSSFNFDAGALYHGLYSDYFDCRRP